MTWQAIIVPVLLHVSVAIRPRFVQQPVSVVSCLMLVFGVGLTLFSLAAWPSMRWRYRCYTCLAICALAVIARVLYALAGWNNLDDF